MCLCVFHAGLGLGAGRRLPEDKQLLAGHKPQLQAVPRRQLLQNILRDLADSLRQASVADARSRIRSAVDSGGEREMVAGASQRGPNVPLRRAMLQAVSSLTDTMRSVQQQDRAATSSAMIRRAVNGEMDVSEAIQGAQTRPRAGTLVSTAAERAAGPAAPQGRALP